MKLTALGLIIVFALSSFGVPSLKGNWTFQGGIYNGKKEGAPKDYTLQRRYQSDKFDAYIMEKGEKTQKYQSGKYTIDESNYLETETYSLQASKMTGKTVKYHYVMRHDTLVLQGTLPTGMTVEEYWKRQK